MSTPTTSLVAVSKHDALLAAKDMQEYVTTTRAKAREEDILRVIQKERIRVGWFKSRLLSRVEAEAMVERNKIGEDGFPDEYGWWSLKNRGNETFAKRLIAAAQLSQDDRIWLSLDEALVMSSFLPKT